MKSQHPHTHGRADFVGIAGSILCIVHCIATPLLTVGTSLWLRDDLHRGLHLMNYLFIAINGIAVYYATRQRHSLWLNRFLWAAFALFSMALLLEDRNHILHYVSYAGSGLLIIGHTLNLYLCRVSHH